MPLPTVPSTTTTDLNVTLVSAKWLQVHASQTSTPHSELVLTFADASDANKKVEVHIAPIMVRSFTS